MKWIQNYLTNRTQYTTIGKKSSSRQQVNYGVPQGSIIGPLIVTLFCDDLPNCTVNTSEDIEMYADDTTLTCVSDIVDHVVAVLQEALKKIENWCSMNGNNVNTP